MNPFINIEGNLVADPELRFAESGTAYARLRVCVSNKDKNGNETKSYYDVVAFNSLAENITNSLQKGAHVSVSGRISLREFDRKDGTKGLAAEIRADDVAASLRFATVSVTKNQRNDAPQGGIRSYASAGANSGGFDDF